jgi:flagellar motor switch/type III secretory pathway protein FliN
MATQVSPQSTVWQSTVSQSMISPSASAAPRGAAAMQSAAGPGVSSSDAGEGAKAGAGSNAGESATDEVNLVASSNMHPGMEVAADAEDSGLQLSAHMGRLPVALAVSVPVREFRIRNLLAMNRGELIETQWGHGEDLPLSSGDVQLAWSEFEVVDTRLAVRVTRLA